MNANKYYVHSATYKPVKSTFTLWHSRLGHASSNVVQSVITYCNISCNKLNTICESCVLAKSHQLPFLDQTLFTLLLYN